MRAVAAVSLVCCILDGAVATQVNRLVPKLENVASDKKFFGPPFPADYPDDMSPAAHDLNPKKRQDVYPKLKDTSAFSDHDYVKDENGDGGEWEAQMAYDNARIKYDKENQLSEAAKDRLRRESAEAAAAEAHAKEATAAADAAKKAAAEDEKGAAGAKDVEAHIADAAKKAETEAKKHADTVKKQHFTKDEINHRVNETGDALAKAQDHYDTAEMKFRTCHEELVAAQAELAALEKQFALLKKRQDELNGVKPDVPSGEDYSGDIEVAQARVKAAEAKAAAAKAKVESFEAQEREHQAEYDIQKHDADDAAVAAEKAAKDQAEAKVEYEAAKDQLRNLRNPSAIPSLPTASTMPTMAPLPSLLPNSGTAAATASALVLLLAACMASL